MLRKLETVLCGVLCLMCIVSGLQTCSGNQTNYTGYDYITCNTSIVQYENRIIVIPAHKDCNIIEKILWFIFSGCKEKTEITKISTTIYKTKLTPVPVIKCCPGYRNKSMSCIEGCGPGKYGDNCTINCSCANETLYCDSMGTCICPAGYTGGNCSDKCDTGFYGFNCSWPCMCENNSTCNQVDGSCNCTGPGWKGDLCQSACNGTYGLHCTEHCTCNDNQTCSPINGSCTCKAGWTGENCSAECEENYFGLNCTKPCTCYKNNTERCDKRDGFCHCLPGYIGTNCSHECPYGLWGPNCDKNCSDHCNGTDYCYPQNSICVCLGKKGENCSEDCDTGMFGPDCKYPCNCTGSNMNGSCHANNGKCNCNSGWQGDNCMTECQNGTYGVGCNASCTCEEYNKCDPVDGTCSCEAGWKGFNCSSACNGTYGLNCTEICMCNENQDCNPVNGSCTCKAGWKGTNCSEGSLQGQEKRSSFPLEYTLIGIFVGAALAAFVVILFCLLRRKGRRSEKDPLDSNGMQNLVYGKEIEDISDTHPDVGEEAEDHDYDDASLLGFSDGVIPKNDRKISSVEGCKDTKADKSIAGKTEFSNANSTSTGTPFQKDGQEIFDTTIESRHEKTDTEHEYNTFEGVCKQANTSKETNEQNKVADGDYDTLEHGHSICSHHNKPVNENYTTVNMNKQPIFEESSEEIFNILNEETNKRRTVAVYDQNYHHIDLASKTIDGIKILDTLHVDTAKTDPQACLANESLDRVEMSEPVTSKSPKLKKSTHRKPKKMNDGSTKSVDIDTSKTAESSEKERDKAEDDLAVKKREDITGVDAALHEDTIYDDGQSTNICSDETEPIKEHNAHVEAKVPNLKTTSLKNKKTTEERKENKGTRQVSERRDSAFKHTEGHPKSKIVSLNDGNIKTAKSKAIHGALELNELRNDPKNNCRSGITKDNKQAIADKKTHNEGIEEPLYEEVPEGEIQNTLYDNVTNENSHTGKGLTSASDEKHNKTKVAEGSNTFAETARKQSLKKTAERRKVDYEEFRLSFDTVL